MCGIVQNPVSAGSLVGRYPSLDREVVSEFEDNAVEYHIPLSAAQFVLSIANTAAELADNQFQHVPLAVYADGLRMTTTELAALEDDVFHVAMAGTLLHFFNEGLRAKHGFIIAMSHCCGGDIIPANSQVALSEGFRSSHELNVLRGDKIRGLTQKETEIIGWGQFDTHLSDFAWRVYQYYKCLQLAHTA